MKLKGLFHCRAKDSWGRIQDFYVRGRNFNLASQAARDYLDGLSGEKDPLYEIVDFNEIGKIVN